MIEFSQMLHAATGRICQSYFFLPIDGGTPIYRERVYCYELYHQLRLLWPTNSSLFLSGELDKAGHPILKDLGASYAKPDLLVHLPGEMQANNIVMEIKATSASNRGISKDLDTLSIFRTAVGYQRAIYLVYGNETENSTKRIRKIAKQKGIEHQFELWIHKSPGQGAMKVPW